MFSHVKLFKKVKTLQKSVFRVLYLRNFFKKPGKSQNSGKSIKVSLYRKA